VRFSETKEKLASNRSSKSSFRSGGHLEYKKKMKKINNELKSLNTELRQENDDLKKQVAENSQFHSKYL
jgi:hypothetical protein